MVYINSLITPIMIDYSYHISHFFSSLTMAIWYKWYHYHNPKGMHSWPFWGLERWHWENFSIHSWPLHEFLLIWPSHIRDSERVYDICCVVICMLHSLNHPQENPNALPNLDQPPRHNFDMWFSIFLWMVLLRAAHAPICHSSQRSWPLHFHYNYTLSTLYCCCCPLWCMWLACILFIYSVSLLFSFIYADCSFDICTTMFYFLF